MGYLNGDRGSSETSVKGEKGEDGLPGIGFKLTDDGNFDIDEKRLTDVADPVDDGDAVTKKYVDSKADKNDVILRDGSQNMTGNLDLNDKKITNLADSTDDGDAVSLKVLKSHTQFSQNNYHLQKSFRFYKNFGDERELVIAQAGSPNLLPQGHFYRSHIVHHDARLIAKESFDNGFGGQAWSSVKMTNDLTSGTYTSVFEIFTVDLLNGVYLTDDTIIYHVHGDSHYTINTFDSDKIDNKFTRSVIQFTSDGQPGEITFQIRYYGSLYDKHIRFIFFSRVIKGKQSTSFNHSIFNLSDVDDNHEILYFENINLNGNKIESLGDPVDDSDAANKKYVDVENSKQDIAIADKASKSYVDGEIGKVNIDTTPLLPRDGSRSMFGDLNMGNQNILSVENLTDYKDTDDLNYRHKDLHSVVNKHYLNENFLKTKGYNFDLNQKVIKNSAPYDDGSYDANTLVSKAYVDNKISGEINKLPKPDTDVLKLDGSKAMTGNLDMSDHTIIGIKSSSQDNAALTVGGAKSTYLTLNGTKSMTGNLDMGKFTIKNVKPFVEDSNLPQDNEVINFGYFKTQRNTILSDLNTYSTDYLSRKNPSPMEKNIDMGKNSIVNLKEPKSSDSSYAATVKFVKDAVNDSQTTMDNIIDEKIEAAEVRSIKSVSKENVFQKVMTDDLFKEDDDDLHKVGSIDKDFHKVNRQTYLFRIDYDSQIGYYSTRASVDLVYLPIGYYTMVYEMYFSNKIDPDEITINARSGTLSVSKINTKISADHTRSIINFYKAIVYPGFDDLDIDIALKNRAGQSYDADTEICVVVYGVSGSQNDVDTRLWDRFYYIENQKVVFEAPIDMNDKQIKKLLAGNEDSDAVNFKQFNDSKTSFQKSVSNLQGSISTSHADLQTKFNKNSVLIKAIYRNLIRNDSAKSKLLLIKDLYFPDSNEGRTQNNYSYQTNDDNEGDVTFYLAFQHKATTSDSMIITLHWTGGIPSINIFVSKNRVVVSKNALINEPSLKIINIPNNAKGKQLYFWLFIKDDTIKIIFSGLSKATTVSHPDLQNKDDNFSIIYVSDSPFTIRRGLITKNIYNLNSDAYDDIKEFEKSQGTII